MDIFAVDLDLIVKLKCLVAMFNDIRPKLCWLVYNLV